MFEAIRAQVNSSIPSCHYDKYIHSIHNLWPQHRGDKYSIRIDHESSSCFGRNINLEKMQHSWSSMDFPIIFTSLKHDCMALGFCLNPESTRFEWFQFIGTCITFILVEMIFQGMITGAGINWKSHFRLLSLPVGHYVVCCTGNFLAFFQWWKNHVNLHEKLYLDKLTHIILYEKQENTVEWKWWNTNSWKLKMMFTFKFSLYVFTHNIYIYTVKQTTCIHLLFVEHRSKMALEYTTSVMNGLSMMNWGQF